MEVFSKFEFLSKIDFIVGTGAVWFWKWRGRRTKFDSKWNLDNHKSGKTFILRIITCSSLCWSSLHSLVFLCPASIESIAQPQLASDLVSNLYDTIVTIKTIWNYKSSLILFFFKFSHFVAVSNGYFRLYSSRLKAHSTCCLILFLQCQTVTLFTVKLNVYLDGITIWLSRYVVETMHYR